ncbi:PREDICTED: PI-stichotoxin-She2a-like isoform X2 [Acropora digitifera]|uniref:PI-stichotoxin-She2a-like isoform X2 n=1 Tax=Acropora digitifera TaxID=70779 RepID=UPI00077AE283|nr:PREDICTED: PI-stichotoxin-She2a-like isoform X2 [Acropora digitifera]
MPELSSISVKSLLVVLVLLAAGLSKGAGYTTTNGNDCSSTPDTGPCRGYFPKFYFDPSDNKCKEFIYGGCGGNGNRYGTKGECKNTCGGLDSDDL